MHNYSSLTCCRSYWNRIQQRTRGEHTQEKKEVNGREECNRHIWKHISIMSMSLYALLLSLPLPAAGAGCWPIGWAPIVWGQPVHTYVFLPLICCSSNKSLSARVIVHLQSSWLQNSLISITSIPYNHAHERLWTRQGREEREERAMIYPPNEWREVIRAKNLRNSWKVK